MTPQDTKLQAALERLRAARLKQEALVNAGCPTTCGCPSSAAPGFPLHGEGCAFEAYWAAYDSWLKRPSDWAWDLLAGKDGAPGALELLFETHIEYADYELPGAHCPVCAFLAAATEALDAALRPPPEA